MHALVNLLLKMKKTCLDFDDFDFVMALSCLSVCMSVLHRFVFQSLRIADLLYTCMQGSISMCAKF